MSETVLLAPGVSEALTWVIFTDPLVRDDHVDHTGPSMAPSSFTGPTVYTDKGKMQKVPFDKIKDNKADYERRADDGWIAMVQHYFVGAWLRNEPGARAFDVSESPSKLVTLSMVTAFPTIAPGATLLSDPVAMPVAALAIGLVGLAMERVFLRPLGFDPLPQTFWDRSQIVKPRDREVVCHASAWDLDNKNDIRIKMCTKVNGDDFVTIHHELGHNYYQRAYQIQKPL